MLAKIKDILLISTPEDLPRFKKLLRDGSHIGINIEYREQEKPRRSCRGFYQGEDCIFVEELVEHFGTESFDVIIATELLEHVKDWRLVINNMKQVLKPGGYIYITTTF